MGAFDCKIKPLTYIVGWFWCVVCGRMYRSDSPRMCFGRMGGKS